MRAAPGHSPRLVLNSTSLMASTVLTSAVGLAYWALAARLASPGQVGTGSALVSAATLLAGLAQLSLGMFALRHLPTAGDRAARWVTACFMATGATAVVLAVGYVALGLGGAFLAGGPTIAVFVVAVPVLALFILQDSVVLGLGAAPLVPVQNLAFSLAKLALLPALAGLAVVSGIFLSWVLTAAVAVTAVMIVVYRGLVHVPTPRREPLPPRRELGRFLALQYVVVVTAHVAAFGMPLLVVARLGTVAAGFFALPWMIGSAFEQLNNAVLRALSVHATAANPVTRAELARTAGLLGLVCGVGAVVLAVLAPVVLDVAAPGYAAAGTPLLRTMCLAAPFVAVWQLGRTLLWLDGRMRLLAITDVLAVAAVLALAWLLTPVLGLVAPGWACVIGYGTGALLSAPWLVRRLRPILAAPVPSAVAEPVTSAVHPPVGR